MDDGEVARLYAQWRLPVLRYVHRLTGDPALAEDVLHEAFCRLLRATEPLQAPGPWLLRVAANLARDAGRRATAADRLAPLADVTGSERPDVLAERADDVARVRRALDTLSPRDREVLLMRESGFDYVEIAAVHGIQPQSVPSVVMRALRRLRAAYADAHPASAGDERSNGG